MTGEEILTGLREGRPDLRFALHREGHTLAVWSDTAARFVAIIMATIDHKWVRLDFEVRVNGSLPYTDADFIEGELHGDTEETDS